MDNKEKEKRDARNQSEKRRREKVNIYFTELRRVLHSHGYPIKADKSTTLQNTIDFLQKQQAASRSKSCWNLILQDCEHFTQETLQLLNGFLITLSTDGVIVYVAANISSLLGHVPAEVIGKKLLSFLPDQEKKEVHNKITLNLPVPDSERHIEFYCHFKRGNVDYDDNPTYEHVKFIMDVNDIFHGPFVLFGDVYNRPGSQISTADLSVLPVKEQYYLVGTVCILSSDMLKELCTLKEVYEEVSEEQKLNENSQLKDLSGDQRTSTMESFAETPVDVILNTLIDSMETKQSGPCEHTDDKKTKLEASYDPSTTSQAAMPELPSISGHLNNQKEHSDLKAKSSSMWHPGLIYDVEKNKWAKLASPSTASHTTVQPSTVSLSTVPFTTYHKPGSIHMSRQQLGRKTWPCQSDIKPQQEMHPTTSLQADNSQSQSSDLGPKKPSLKRIYLNLMDTKHFCGSRSPASLKFPGKSSAAPSQKEQQQEPQLPKEQLPSLKELQPKELPPQEPLQHSVVTGSQALQLCLPPHTDVSVPSYRNSVPLMQTQSIPISVQLKGAKKKPSVYYQDENHGPRGDKHHGFLPEEQQASSADPQALAQNPGPRVCSSAVAHSPSRPSSSFSTLESAQDNTGIWQQAGDQQHHLFYQLETWATRNQATVRSQGTWNQIHTPEAVVQGQPGPEALQALAKQQPNKQQDHQYSRRKF